MSRIKLVVPPNLLKQENVCLIPREAEHPSILFIVWTYILIDFQLITFAVNWKEMKRCDI